MGGIAEVIPVDAYIPGCPPRPEAIIDGVVKLLGSLKNAQPEPSPSPDGGNSEGDNGGQP
jgi:NADH:ubiquinone oxidoreductase subunit B-like Fe-S oxidoreductase